MSSNRITYQNWIVDIGFDPERRPPQQAAADDPGRQAEIRERVNAALAKLDEQEREFIVRFHFQGQTYRSISERSGRPVHRLETLHRRALRRLRRELAGWVEETFGIDVSPQKDCVICRSANRPAIDRLIASRDRTRSWRPVIEQLRERYGLVIRSPQTLIGHEKYHC